jgi:hypothetical protein
MKRAFIAIVACIALLSFYLAGVEPVGGQGKPAVPPSAVPPSAVPPSAVPPSAVVQETRCSDCHTRANPTKEDPCLVPCPRFTPEHGPEVVLIDQLSKQYVPVVFAHKLHAQMTEMSGGCALCHHFNPSHKILPCRDCHNTPSPDNLAKPGLKGAYHRQCMNCHREWSHETECAVCHAKKTADSAVVVLPDPTDIMGTLHPNIEEPVVKTYETKYEHGKSVTFRHQDHVKRYGFKCVNCHREPNCNRCHNTDKVAAAPKSLQQHHSPCASCHDTSVKNPAGCGHCHADKETPPFTHASTGLVLDEAHSDAACFDCHIGSKFDKKPSCTECHDAEDKITYPEKLPGKKVKTP